LLNYFGYINTCSVQEPVKMISGISIRAVKTFPKIEITAKLWKSLAYRGFKK